MKVLFFNKNNRDISDFIDPDLIHTYQIKVISSENYLLFRNELSKSFSGETIVVFIVEDMKDLSFIEEVQKYMLDMKLIIKHFDGLINSGRRILKLKPTLVIDSSYTDTSEVRKIISGVIKEVYKINKY